MIYTVPELVRLGIPKPLAVKIAARVRVDADEIAQKRGQVSRLNDALSSLEITWRRRIWTDVEAGEAAALAGRKAEDCPFDPGTFGEREWLHGYWSRRAALALEEMGVDLK